MVNAFFAFFRIDHHRSKEAFERLIKDWKGILASIDYASHRLWEGKGRQTPLAHIKRTAKGYMESKNQIYTRCGKRILSALKALMDLEPTQALVR